MINILHLSDLHMSKEDLPDIQIILKALIADVKAFTEQGKRVDFVCFTGDLIHRGDKADEQLELSMDYFIDPLMEALNLSYDRFLLIPGNHDVDRNKIDPFSEEGFRQMLKRSEDINAFLDNIRGNIHHLSRTQEIRDFINFLHQETNEWSDPLTYTKKFQIGDTIVGIACFDSAWRCSGDNDLRSLIVGEREIDKALDSLDGSDIKLALVHHPLSWLVEEDERAVTPLFNNFHVVLNGHIHDLGGSKLITPGQSTLYSTCGALYSGHRSTFNGYNFIEIDPHRGYVTFNLREYFDTPRRCFDAAVSKCENGVFEHTLDTEDKSVGQALDIIHSITPSFQENINNLLVSTLLDHNASNSFDSVFVAPNLNKTSDYIKDSFDVNEEDSSYDLNKLILSGENIFFIGKEEAGKTTLLHYIANHYLSNYSQYFQVPICIDFNEFLAGKQPIERQMVRFITDHYENQNTPNLDIVINLLEKERCVLLIDNINLSNTKHIERLNEFMKKYPGNRFIVSAIEDVFKSISEKLPKFEGNYKEVYIRTLSKSGIRELIKKWFTGKDIDIDQLLERILLYFNHVGMPRTPYAVSLILATCNQYEDFIPINEANVMENFMEIVFEKLSLDNTKINTYDFHSKEKFLSHLAWVIAKGNNKWLTLTDFYRVTAEYHDIKGLNLQKSKFDEFFFIKGILLKKDNKIYFRYKSFQEYYLAKAATNNNTVLEWILKDEQYFKHINELSFYTGIKRGDLSVICFIQEKLYELLQPMSKKISTLENYGLDSSLLPDIKEIKYKPTLSEKEKDQLTNLPDNSKEVNPYDDDEIKDDKMSLLKLVNLYGRMIRNSEDLELKDKMVHLKACFQGYVTLLAIFKDGIEEALKEFKNEQTEMPVEDIKKMESVIKYVAPLALQNIAFEAVGTSKLDKTLIELISTEKNEFIKFMVVILYSDLKLENFMTAIRSLISTVDNRDILLLIKAKLQIYYGVNQIKDKDNLITLMADIEIKVNNYNKFVKNKIIHDLRKQL